MTRQIHNQKGVAAVEFALVLPLLVILTFGIIEFSICLYDKAVITNASREGARAGILFGVPRPTNTDIGNVVNNYCQNRLITFGSSNPVTTTILRGGTGATGDPLKVQVQYQYNFLILPGFIAQLTGGLHLGAETVMRME